MTTYLVTLKGGVLKQLIASQISFFRIDGEGVDRQLRRDLIGTIRLTQNIVRSMNTSSVVAQSQTETKFMYIDIRKDYTTCNMRDSHML